MRAQPVTDWTGPALPSILYTTQGQASELVQEAMTDFPPQPHQTQRSNIVRLLLAMLNIQGSPSFPRGWAREVMLGLHNHGCAVPTSKVLRWYRSGLAVEPQSFVAKVEGYERRLDVIEFLQFGKALGLSKHESVGLVLLGK